MCYTSTMDTKRHNLYIPTKLYEKIEYLRQKDMRSFNKECIFLLVQAVEHRREDLEGFEEQEKKDESIS